MKNRKCSWLYCIKNYRFHSIFIKNCCLIFAVILLPFSCVLGISCYSYNQIQESENTAYIDEMRTIIYKDVEGVFQELRDKMIMAAYETDVQMFFHTKLNQKQVYYDFFNITNFLDLFELSSEIVDAIYLYAPNSGNVVASNYGMTHYEEFWDKTCIETWQENGAMYQFAYLERVINRQLEKNICIYLTIQYEPDCSGVVVVNINMDKLRGVLDYGEDVSLTLIENGQALFDSDETRVGMKIENVNQFIQAMEQEVNSEIRKMQVVYSQLENISMELILLVKNPVLAGKMHSISSFMIVFVGVMLFISVAFAFYISWKIFDPIAEVLKSLEETPEVNEEILQHENEVSYIRNAIYTTVSKYKDVEQELIERISLLKKAQAVALQAQINPHFINNTLETINWMIVSRLGIGNEVSEMLSHLLKLTRISFKDTNTFVTLKEEIEYANVYLFIQQKRLIDKFDVVFDIPEELMSCKIIKMVLQPLIENAINYGISPYHSKGKLWITAVKNEDKVCISIRDSGLGIPKDRVDEINKSMHCTTIKESTHIGLSNVNQRLILAFGDAYGVSLYSGIGEGTVVTVKIPWQI